MRPFPIVLRLAVALLLLISPVFAQAKKDDPKLSDFVGKWIKDINGSNAITVTLAFSADGQTLTGTVAHFAVYGTYDGKTFNTVESVGRGQDHDKIIHASLRNGVLHVVCKTPDDGDPMFWGVILHGKNEADLIMEGHEDDPRTVLKSWELTRVR
jgi:hypothetical protein